MIALDLGCHEFRSLRKSNGRLAGRRHRTDYIALPISAAKKEILDQSNITYSHCDDSLLLLGKSADAWSRMVQVPISSVLPEGTVPENDPPAKQLMANMVDALLPEAVSEHEICAVTLPSGRIEEKDNPELNFFAQMIRMKGYRILPVHASHSLVLAELGKDHGLTGIAISFGANRTEMSFARHGVELMHSSLPIGSHLMEQELAQFSDCYAWDTQGDRFLDFETIRDWKNSPERNLDSPANEDEQFLLDSYRTLIQSTMVKFMLIMNQRKEELHQLPQPVPLVLSGGLCQIKGFRKLFGEMLSQIPFPIKISQIIVANNSTWNVARGSLIHAELAYESAQDFTPVRKAA